MSETKTHDYTKHRGWGHDYTFRPREGGTQASAMGWGYGIRAGDFLLLEQPQNPDGAAKYRVDAIEYFDNPTDMWSAQLSYVPRAFCQNRHEVAPDATTCEQCDVAARAATTEGGATNDHA